MERWRQWVWECVVRGLDCTSVGCCVVRMCCTSSLWFKTLSCRKCKSNSTWFVLVWQVRLASKDTILRLSHQMIGDAGKDKDNSVSKDCIQTSSARARYPTFNEIWKSVPWFLLDHITWFNPKKTIIPEVKHRSSKEDAQYAL